MQVAPVLFAMNPSIGIASTAVVIGLVLFSLGRVVNDAVAWYRDQIKDPYRDLRTKAQESRRTKKSPGQTDDESHVIRNRDPDETSSSRRPPSAG